MQPVLLPPPGPARMREYFSTHGSLRTFFPGEIIYHYGEVREEISYLDEGRVRLYTLDSEGREETVCFIQTGRTFGEPAVLTGRACFTVAEAASACRVYVLPRSALIKLAGPEAQVLVDLLFLLSDKVERLTARMQITSKLDPKRRLAWNLMYFAREFGVLGAQNTDVSFCVSQQHLGDLMMVSRVTVNKLIKQLAEDGIIRQKGRHICILDEDRLRQLAATD